jgi:predicted TIM-barrel fold metal-dependent hydrolase
MYFDTSSPGDAHLAAIDAFAGTDQALFGTDGPWTNLTQIGIAIRGLVEFDGFDAAQLRAVERDNAQRLFPRFAQAA